MCRAFYNNAEKTWEEYNYVATQQVLNNIIAKCPVTETLPVLGLILLPAILRRFRWIGHVL
jgi:hypothetical protein